MLINVTIPVYDEEERLPRSLPRLHRLLHRIGEDRTGGPGDLTFLLRDRDGWHPRGRWNAVFVDGRAGPV